MVEVCRVMRLVALVFTLTASLWTYGAEADTMTGIFHPDFKSLQVTLAGNPYAPPVIALDDEGDRIVVSFDELSDDRRYMRYSLTHCDAFWRPEELVVSEYLDGFNEGVVDDYAFSQATLVHYVHYTITIPDADRGIRITQPGNYLLRVYDEVDPEVTLLQARFGVSDFSAPVSAEVTSRTDIDFNKSHQQVTFTVDTGHLSISDPYSELKVVVSQNSRVDNEVVVSTPLRVNGNKLMFEHDKRLVFPAGNEYRRFETVSTSYPGMGVDQIVYAEPMEYDNPYYNMVLATDYPRRDSGYEYDRTQQGRYVVRDANADDSNVGADYVMVHFSLEMPEIPDATVFLDGDFVNRRFDSESAMVYDRGRGRYEKSMLLKQGAYNYQYVVVPYGSHSGLTAMVEGDFYPTGNEYLIKVYHRPKSSRFDRLVGVSLISNL